MNKCIIVLDGVSEGKTRFVNLAKTDGYWTWNLNARNVLSVASRSIGWNGVKDDKYYDFINRLMGLVNEYWQFKQSYILSMIQKFKVHEKAQVLIIHDAGDIEGALKVNPDVELYFVYIRKEVPVSETFRETFYDRVLNCATDDFDQSVLDLLGTLTK